MARTVLLAGLVLLVGLPISANAMDDYPLGPDSQPQAGVPRGATFSFHLDDSKVFPGARREVTVYVPAAYTADRPACLYVGLDGLGFHAATVFDNLIHRGELPTIIAVGISPGTVASATGDNPRFNRSTEFDGLDGSLARLVVDEVLPAVRQRKTPGGLPILLSDDPNDRCTGGASTGGIGAFTLAWGRPDQFRRVFSAIGTFVRMRGGDRYPVLVRLTEPKPLRVFQQDGSADEWMGGPEVGDWWMGNQYLDRSLEFAGYEHAHAWGDGPHSTKQADAVFPDAMRFLWHGWPQPVRAHPERSGNVILRQTVDPTSTWEPVAGLGGADSLAVNPAGDVVCRTDGTVRAVTDGGPKVEATGPFAFAADGRVVTAGDLATTCLTVTNAGDVYATAGDRVLLVRRDGPPVVLDEGLRRPTGVAVSPDGLWLAVMDGAGHVGYSYAVQPDGSVRHKQRFYWAQVGDDADDSGAGSACFDRDGRLYVATRMGVQIFDRNGRSRGVLPLPGDDPATSVCFGGGDLRTLFAAGTRGVYRRHMTAVGHRSTDPTLKLPPWGAG